MSFIYPAVTCRYDKGRTGRAPAMATSKDVPLSLSWHSEDGALTCLPYIVLQQLFHCPHLFENHLTEDRGSKVKQQNPALSALFIWKRQQEMVGKTCPRHLALQDIKKSQPTVLAFREGRSHRLSAHNWSPEDCCIAQLVLHLYRDKVAGVPHAGNGGISSIFF